MNIYNPNKYKLAKTNLRYSIYRTTDITLEIFPDHYSKSIATILELQAHLLAIVPFEFRIITNGGASVVVLGGQSHKGKIAVEMAIVPTSVTVEEAVELLKAAGFLEGLEST